jgi:hypothetical protein
MLKTTIATLCLILSVMVVSRVAHAQYIMEAGNSCQAGFGNTIIDQDDYGVGNQDTTSAHSVLCPINVGSSSFYYATLSNVLLFYTDVTTTQPFWCYTYQNEINSGEWWGSTLFTCSTGGCPDSTTSFTGSNSLEWNGTTGFEFPQGGSTWTIYWLDNAGYRCNLPPATSTSWSGRSWITAHNENH